MRNDAQAHTAQGDVLSVWVNLGSSPGGRSYFAFGAGASGAMSAVLAPNTTQFIIQDNTGYSYMDLAAQSQAYQANHWYLVRVNWGLGGAITATLLDSNGTTVLNTVSASSTAFTAGGIGFRSFEAAMDWDTVTKNGGVGGGYMVVLSAGQTVTGKDFGNHAHPGTIAGDAWNDLDGDGVRDAGEPALAGWTVYMDLNNNGQPDSTIANYTVEPDNYTSGTVLNTVVPGVTLSAHGSYATDNQVLAMTSSYPSTGTMGFGNTYWGPYWYNGEEELWADFASPVSSVSIDTASYYSSDQAQLRAYDASGNLLATYITPVLTPGQVATMTITRPTADIAEIRATGYGGEYVSLDHLTAVGTSAEPSAVTDASGHYAFSNVSPGTYNVREVLQSGWAQSVSGRRSEGRCCRGRAERHG